MTRRLRIGLLIVMAAARQGLAQGMLPAAPAPSTATPTAVMIGLPVPDTVTLRDDGILRPLTSYKTALDVLVVGFWSARCPDQDAERHRLRRFYQKYRDWRVAFVVINEGPPASMEDLSASLRREGMTLSVVQDPGHAAANAMQVQAVPTYLILDESKILRYRGDLAHAARALDAVVGHTEPVPQGEVAVTGGCAL